MTPDPIRLARRYRWLPAVVSLILAAGTARAARAEEMRGPVAPVAPTDPRECDALDKAWSQLFARIGQMHEQCLASYTNSDVKGGPTCTRAPCQPYHDPSRRFPNRNRDVEQCRAVVRAHQQRLDQEHRREEQQRQLAEQAQRATEQAQRDHQARQAEAQRQLQNQAAEQQRQAMAAQAEALRQWQATQEQARLEQQRQREALQAQQAARAQALSQATGARMEGLQRAQAQQRADAIARADDSVRAALDGWQPPRSYAAASGEAAAGYGNADPSGSLVDPFTAPHIAETLDNAAGTAGLVRDYAPEPLAGWGKTAAQALEPAAEVAATAGAVYQWADWGTRFSRGQTTSREDFEKGRDVVFAVSDATLPRPARESMRMIGRVQDMTLDIFESVGRAIETGDVETLERQTSLEWMVDRVSPYPPFASLRRLEQRIEELRRLPTVVERKAQDFADWLRRKLSRNTDPFE